MMVPFMNSATDAIDSENARCPFCHGETEFGCLMGKDSLLGFQWYDGHPSFWKNAIPHGESVGGYNLLTGTHLTGLRCRNCRKLLLDY